ncbi:hypothetical protein ACB098_03G023500 [Castanea mollissima]
MKKRLGTRLYRMQDTIVTRASARKCCGLLLAIKSMGMSLRNKMISERERWMNVLSQLQGPVPHYGSIMKDIYLPLRLSYKSLARAILMTTSAPPFKRISLYLECMKVAIFGILGIN